jgi:hypothetical protein
LSAGTSIANVLDLFAPGKEYVQGEEPKDILLYNHAGLLEGKKVKNAVKSGETVKLADVAEPDGSPWQPPQL